MTLDIEAMIDHLETEATACRSRADTLDLVVDQLRNLDVAGQPPEIEGPPAAPPSEGAREPATRRTTPARPAVKPTGDLPFVCTVCSRAFARKNGLSRHMTESHDGAKPAPLRSLPTPTQTPVTAVAEESLVDVYAAYLTAGPGTLVDLTDIATELDLPAGLVARHCDRLRVAGLIRRHRQSNRHEAVAVDETTRDQRLAKIGIDPARVTRSRATA